jgi:hypothetical protein
MEFGQQLFVSAVFHFLRLFSKRLLLLVHFFILLIDKLIEVQGACQPPE